MGGADVKHEKPSTPTVSIRLTLQGALDRAKALSPVVEVALTNVRIAGEGTLQARASNLPIVTANSQYLYTQGNGTPAARFIANNGVHEYIAQANIHQAISVPLFQQYRRSQVLEALARNQAAIAQRGLVVTVVQNYVAVVSSRWEVEEIRRDT